MLAGPYTIDIQEPLKSIYNSAPHFTSEPDEYFFIPGKSETYLVGNIVDDEGNDFGLSEEVVIQYDWVELDVSDPSKPRITVEPPRDLFDSDEHANK